MAAWGQNIYGQTAPCDDVFRLSDLVTDVGGGLYHSCAVLAGTGNVACWGAYSDGQATPPDSVNGVSGSAVAVTTGDYHSCAIQAQTRAVICWGEDADLWPPPDSVNGVSGTAALLSAGSYHDCATQTGTGKVVCWGANHEHQLEVPREVSGVSGTASAVASGGNHSCAIQAGTGKVVCWGQSRYGQTAVPDAVNGVLGTASRIATGAYVSCAVQAETGKLFCWGNNYFDLLTTPDEINGNTGTAVEIGVGLDHACAIQAGTRKVVCWGDNPEGQTTPPDTVNGVWGTARVISVGMYHTLAIVAPPEVEAADPQPTNVPPTPTPAPLTAEQHACVAEVSTGGARVHQAQLDEIQSCLADFQNGRLAKAMTFDACTTADRTGRIRKAQKLAASRDAKACEALDALVSLGYADLATVNAAAVEGALALTHKLLGGPPVLDASLATRAEDRPLADCQLEMLARASRLESSVIEQVNGAKAEALQFALADGSSPFDAKSRAVRSTLLWDAEINSAQDLLVDQVDGKCSGLQTPLDAIFPGGCASEAADLPEVLRCASAAARCEACSTINRFGGLTFDCDQADDQVANRSCP